jgi:NADPH:quinone reductase-like Zn-dependent oxidoreductase
MAAHEQAPRKPVNLPFAEAACLPVAGVTADEAQSLGLTSALDYTKPLPDSLEGTFDIVLDCNGSLSVREEECLRKRAGKIVDVVPSSAKFLRALISRSRKVILIDPKAETLQPVVDLAAVGKLAVPVARTVALAEEIRRWSLAKSTPHCSSPPVDRSISWQIEFVDCERDLGADLLTAQS